MKNEKIFITGGTGYLGKELIKKLLPNNTITVFSRDKIKQNLLKKEFPSVRFVVGDIKDEKLLTRALKGHTIAIFTASLKRIEEVDNNVREASHIMIDGTFNSRNAAIANGLKAAIFISSCQSRMPTTLYGALKYVAGESFIMNAEKEKTNLTTVLCGNIINSTGSIIPLIWKAIREDIPLTHFGEEMTRFTMDTDEVLKCIEIASCKTGFTVVPCLKSFKVKDLFEIYTDRFDLKWNLGKPRSSEKIHEQIISPYELPRATFDKKDNVNLIHYRTVSEVNNRKFEIYSSDSNKVLMSKKKLERYLKINYFFTP